MNMSRWTHIGIAICSIGAVSLFALVDLERKAPGPLTRVHGREEDLAGSSGCNACHGGWFSTMTASCLECHADIGTQIDESRGLHGSVAKATAQQCSVCHGEHHGENFDIVNKQSFALAGAPDPLAFEHTLVGFEMDGAHLDLKCSECHTHADDAVLEKGARRYMGLDQDCASCHTDVHEGRMVVACASCHGQSKWDGLHSLGHEKQLPLVGGHGDVSCRTCHAENTAHSLEALGAGIAERTVRTCTECHESPHDPDFVAASAHDLHQPVAQVCVACHAAEHTTFRDEHLTLSSEEHARSGFSLDAPHDVPKCAECHDPKLTTFEERYPGRSNDTCSACHADPHGGQFATGPFSTGDCTACHDKLHFEPHTFTLADHELASLPLTGAHARTDCNECHVVPAEDAPRVFRGTAAKCEDCHEDAHDGFFAAAFALAPPPSPGECAACHGTENFHDVPESGFDHGRWTGFPVLGAHAQSSCEICHVPAPVADAFGRTFGWVSAKFGDVAGCVTCHQDPHAGQFDREGLPRTLDGRADCARCHDEVSFRTFSRGFDHGLWTGFVLANEHAETSCSGCHAQLQRPDATGRTWGRSRGSACSDCHTDPHGGQFTERVPLAADPAQFQLRVDCARCHVDDAPAFLDFDHDRDSRFPLSDAHVRLECSACHVPFDQGGVELVRYKPLGTQCVDCHGVHEEVLLRRAPRRER